MWRYFVSPHGEGERQAPGVGGVLADKFGYCLWVKEGPQ